MNIWLAILEISADQFARDEYEPVGRHHEYIALNCNLCTRLGLWWGHMIFPIDAVSPEPPGYIARNDWHADAWAAAYRCRTTLLEAAAPTAT